MDIKSIDNNINFIAHRGCSISAPENTMPAIELAVNNQFDTVECDVSWTKDNIPVLLHDENINRTARKESGFGFILPRKCSNLTYDELLKYDFGIWKNDDYKGTKIPAFEEVVKYCKDNDIDMYIDLKSDNDFTEERADMLVDIVKDYDMQDNTSWISFDKENLLKIRESLPDARLGYLSKTEITDETMSVLEELKNDKNEVFLDIKAKYATEEPKNAGFGMEAWCVKSFEQINDLIDMGYVGITSDFLNDALYELTSKMFK